MTSTTTPSPDVPLPPGAVMAEWQDLEYPGFEFRHFEGRRWVIDRDRTGQLVSSDDVEVYMRGTQKPDGTIDERHVVVHQLHSDDPSPRRRRVS
jgi:hypothetical protein